MRIFLTGFMGSGKTHWAPIWAAVQGMPWFDLDEIIVQTHNRSVEEIFEKSGESYFRLQEAAALRTMIANEHCIIACGGGTPCFDDNMAWMNEHGLTIYLSAGPQFLLDNIMKEKDKRPLLKKVNQSELLFFIEQKLSERQAFYNQAKLILHAETLHEHSLREIIPQT
ncbi:MAG TPA: shikimate kinase [Ferruginibacter sp.]|nr:shikimate kinase [Ferruginibacter sp.]